MKQYATLQQLRDDKLKARANVGKALKRLKADSRDCFAPQSSFLSNSNNRLLNVVGYLFSAYKAVNNARGLIQFFQKAVK